MLDKITSYLLALLSSSTTWIVLAVLTIFAYGVIKATPLKKLPKKTLLLVSIVGILLTTGIFSGFYMGSGSLNRGASVNKLQVTTDFVINTTTTLTGTNKHRLLDIRGAEAWIDTGTENDIKTGVIQVTRNRDSKGLLPATSIDISCQTPPDFEHESSPDGTRYHLVERDNNGVEAIYISTAASSVSAADTSDSQETGSLAFLEGVAVGEVSLLISLEDAGYDVLDQYSYKDITCRIGSAPFTFRVHHMDA